MKPQAFSFLSSVLGVDGAKALRKAADREPLIEPLLVPRTALAWISEHHAYEGNVPGLANSYLKLEKNEAGFTGIVTIGDLNYEFGPVSPEHVAASLALAVNVDFTKAEDVKDKMLVKLGKTLDALVKAQKLTKSLKNAVKEVKKTDLPGTTAKPFKQEGPQEPVAPTKQKNKVKLPRIPAMKVEKSEADKECSACGGVQFVDNRFKGCICFRSLSKSIKTTAFGDGYVLEFPNNFEREAVLAIRRALKGQ
jgi:hypothetical protein